MSNVVIATASSLALNKLANTPVFAVYCKTPKRRLVLPTASHEYKNYANDRYFIQLMIQTLIH